jgi:hypothetical protein
MSFAEIKDQLPSLTREERIALSHALLDLELTDDQEYRKELDRRMADMDAGKKFTKEDIMRLHRELLAQGR